MTDWSARIGTAARFLDERILVADDGRIVMCARFSDRASYDALADSPDQAVWWESTMRPLLDGDPGWIDGQWHDI